VEGELDHRRPEQARSGRSRGAVVELDAVFEPPQHIRARLPFHLDLVDLLHAVARMGETVRERAVVREQERAGRVRVEPAHRDDALGQVDEVDDGGTSLGVARRRDGAAGFVQEDVGEPLGGDGLAVHRDHVAA
jgi:hypothetical protein